MSAVPDKILTNQTTSSSLNLGFTGANQLTAGDGLVVGVTWDNSSGLGNTATITSSQGDTKTVVVEESGTGNKSAQIVWFKNLTGGNTTISISGNGSYINASGVEVAGLDESATPASGSAADYPTPGANPTTPSITISDAGFSLAISNFGAPATIDQEGDWTLLQEDEAWDEGGGGHVYKIQTASGSDSHVWNTNSTSAPWACAIAHFVEAGAGGGTITADGGSYSLTGTAANLEQHRAVGAAAGSYGLTGAAANLERHGEVVAGAGAYALTGVDASLSTGAIVAAAPGSYALTGADANVEHHAVAVAGAGSYALTGQAAGLDLAVLLSADAGSYALIGAAAGLDFTASDEAELIQNHPSPVYSERPPALLPGRISIAITPVSAYSLTASAGTYTLTGVPASLGQQRVIGAASGSYALTGTASNLEQHRAVGAAAGSYALTGAVANVEHHAAVVAGVGSYALTGADASLTHAADNTLVAAAGAYALTGAAANVEHHAAVAAGPGSYALTGQAAGLNLGQFLAAGVGSYALTGVPAGLRLASLVGAQPGAYTLTGADVGFVYTVPGNFTFADLAGRVLRVPREVRTLLRTREDRTLRMN